MFQTKHSLHFDGPAVLLLFTIFAAASLLVVISGSHQFDQAIQQIDCNTELRTASSYVTEKVRHSNTVSDISMTTIDQCDAIEISEIINGSRYNTYIYFYNGTIREITVAEGTSFSPSAGQKICELKHLEILPVNEHLIRLKLTASDDTETSSYIHVLSTHTTMEN